MKRNIKFIYIGLLSFLVAGLYSCNEFEEFDSIPANAPSTVEISTGEIADSSIVVNVTNSSSGYVVAGIAESSSVEIGDKFDAKSFVKQTVEGYAFKKSKVKGEESVSFEFSELVQNTEYVIVAVGTNSDGVASEMANVTITTTDDFEPGLLETTPAASLEPVMTYSGTLTVVFDEPIIFDDSKDITYYGFHSGDELNEVNVAVEGNEVTITPVDSLKPSDIVFVSWEEGTFTDLAGNAYPAMETGLDDDDVPYGLYFGVEPYLYEPTSILPDSSNTVLPSEFDAITIEFEDPIWDVGDGEMKLAYNHPNGDVTIKMVTKDLLTIDGNTLEISLPLAVSPGQTVELIAEEGSVFVGLGNKGLKLLNPSAGMEIAWVIEHPFLQTWVGSYTVEAISYSNPGAWDEDWNVTIIPSADDLNTLLISGIGGSEKAIEAVFDDELMTVTISSGANIGDAYGYGNMGVYNGNSDVTYNEGEPIVGDITEDGGISIDLFGVVFLEDPDTGSVWDIFETTWTHQ